MTADFRLLPHKPARPTRSLTTQFSVLGTQYPVLCTWHVGLPRFVVLLRGDLPSAYGRSRAPKPPTTRSSRDMNGSTRMAIRT